MFRVSSIVVIIIFISACALSQHANQNDEINKIFNEGVQLYSNGNYKDALKIFEKISDDYPYNSKTTASIVFKGKILAALKNFSEAEILLRDFLRKYSESKYRYEAKLALAKAYLGKNEFLRSLSTLLDLYSETSSGLYADEAKKVSEELTLQHLTTAEIKSLYDSAEDNKVKSFLLLLSGKLYIDNGKLTEASETFLKLIRLYPDSKEKIEAEIINSGLTDKNKTTNENFLIGILLPLSGLDRSEELTASNEILEGIKFAFSEYNEERTDKIGTVIFDTENSSQRIKEIKEQIELHNSIKLLIGPVYSTEVSVTLKEFRNSDIPIISPTATDNDLTYHNSNFFQANPNFIVRAKVMAQFIYYVENKRKIAVLNSIDGYSPLLAAEFVREFEKLGGNVVIKSTYKNSSLAYGNQLADFSSKLSSAEGIFLPLADRMDAPLILSQLVQNDVDIPLFGNQDWLLAKGFETSPELSNKMTITSDYFIDYNSDSYQNFNKKFIARTNSEANRNVLYGYDAAKYVLTILRNINPERKNIKSKMESGISVSGFHNNISFDPNRVNRYMNIIKYHDGFFELIDRFKANF
jgi:branched-chain amino acid transport system substrate-binding protein